MSNLNKETDAIYRSDTDEETHRAMSEKVQTMASGIYNEFQHMIKVYDDDVVKRLMPLVVGVLEVLNQSYSDKQEIDVEVELLKTDNEQLLTQYEREKNMRRDTEHKYLETEDIIEENKKLFDVKFEKLENSVKIFELKARNAQDHVIRFEERELEMKNEYSKLHDRYTDLFKKHADVIDRAKGNSMNLEIESTGNKIKFSPSSRGYDDSGIDYNGGGDCTPEQRSRTSTRDSLMDSDLDMDKKLFPDSESLQQEVSKLEQESDNQRKVSIKDEMSEASKGIGKEVENLIQENRELLATKNALNIVKDDLIERVDNITSDHELLVERTKALFSSKEKLTLKLQLAEEELKKLRHLKETYENEQEKKQDEGDVPAAQRKRFTRMEMARVLMERNKYKERLFELQEAVRWAETVRAARDHPDESLRDKKKTGGVWGFFSSLISQTGEQLQAELESENRGTENLCSSGTNTSSSTGTSIV